ncbi:UDP-glucose 4-epimerase [Armadillidium nasatum]|uniref:UDP-glucose 4-epimerase n=1 Tax=Armadillidium nasatum TaxID=96803 RepID=A0A5N5TBT8_9CRUS|nr:UDP-glucose 4-epimerase [Armadillidium nasatum]
MSLNRLTVLVTGGAGYIGSHTVLELLNIGHDLIVTDNCINAVEGENGGKPPALVRVEEITGKTHKIDVVIHFAALKSVGESVKYPLEYYQTTVYGTPQYLPMDENHPTGQKVTNPYGQTKYMSEQILKDLTVSDKSGLIGEDPRGIPTNLMPFISQVAVGKRKTLQVFGSDYDTPDGTGIRDYIHVVDLAIGHVSALKKLFEGSFSGFKAYNLGTGKGEDTWNWQNPIPLALKYFIIIGNFFG